MNRNCWAKFARRLWMLGGIAWYGLVSLNMIKIRRCVQWQRQDLRKGIWIP